MSLGKGMHVFEEIKHMFTDTNGKKVNNSLGKSMHVFVREYKFLHVSDFKTCSQTDTGKEKNIAPR